MRRGVSPVVGVLVMIGIVIILASVVSVFTFGLTERLDDPTPVTGQTTGEFEVGSGVDEQIVRIDHVAGDQIDVENIEIVVEATGPSLETRARLVDLPTDDFFDTAIGSTNIEGDDRLIDERFSAPNQVIVPVDSNDWTTGDTIQFRIAVQGADFRRESDPNFNEDREANKLEITIIHIPSNSILSEHQFTP